MSAAIIKLPYILLLSGLILLSSCSSERYVSKWNDNEIVIDGSQEDWKDKLTYFEDERVAAGILNDEENIYLCLTTDDKGKISQLLNLGLTVWIRPEDDRVKTIGIKYPIMSDNMDMRGMIRRQQNESDAEFLNKLLEGYQEKQNELQIVNEDNYSLYAYRINDGTGIKVRLGESMEQLVYEMSIPIAGNSMSEFMIDLNPGDQLTVGFETNEMQRSEGRGSGRPPSGGMTGGRSGPGTGMSTMPRGSMPGRPEPIDIEFDVKLAK